jgi:hypothetical protein
MAITIVVCGSALTAIVEIVVVGMTIVSAASSGIFVCKYINTITETQLLLSSKKIDY